MPVALGLTVATVPSAAGYLTANPGLVAGWRGRLGASDRLRVGIVWASAPYPDRRASAEMNKLRSMPAEALRPLLDVSEVAF